MALQDSVPPGGVQPPPGPATLPALVAELKAFRTKFRPNAEFSPQDVAQLDQLIARFDALAQAPK